MSGGAEACRQKASSHIDRIKATFTETTTDEEKFAAYTAFFDRIAWAVGRCRENFVGENHCRWTNDPATAEKLKTSEEEGVILLELIHEEMKLLVCSKHKLPLSTVNGTSAVFAKCAQTREAAAADLMETQIVFFKNILKQEPPETLKDRLRRFEASMKSRIASILAPFLFIPDTLWS